MTTEKHLSAIARMMARIIADKSDKDTIDDVLNWAYEVADINEKYEKAKPRKSKVSLADVSSIYDLYPSKDPENNNRLLKYGSKDKDKIRSLIESGKETAESLSRKIRYELECRKESRSFLRNLSTVLNNLPDPVETIFTQPKPTSKYR